MMRRKPQEATEGHFGSVEGDHTGGLPNARYTHWRVTHRHCSKNGVTRKIYQLRYRDRVIKESDNRQDCKESLSAMASSYNDANWKPTFSQWVMNAARILRDSLYCQNGRCVDMCYKNKDGSFSICCHGAAQFWFDRELRIFRWHSPESTMWPDEEEKEAFMELIRDNTEEVSELLENAKGLTEAKKLALSTKVSREGVMEQQREEQRRKLAAWKKMTAQTDGTENI